MGAGGTSGVFDGGGGVWVSASPFVVEHTGALRGWHLLPHGEEGGALSQQGRPRSQPMPARCGPAPPPPPARARVFSFSLMAAFNREAFALRDSVCADEEHCSERYAAVLGVPRAQVDAELQLITQGVAGEHNSLKLKA